MLHLFSSPHSPLPSPFSFFSHSSTPCRTTLLCPTVLLFRIARSSLTADFRTARKSAVFIYGIETPLFCIFIILPQLGAGFCAYYVVGHVLSLLHGAISFFSKKKKGTRERSRLTRDPVHARLFCSSA